MPRPKSVKTAPVKPPAAQAAAAFAKIKPRLGKLKSEEVVTVSTDIQAAVAIVISALPSLHAMREMIVDELPKHPISQLDDLEEYALAAWYANLLHENQDIDEDAQKELHDEAVTLRESLLIAAEALAHRGLLDGERVAELRAGQGSRDAANDLMALAALFVSQWERVKTKTAVEEHEIARAEELGSKLLIALAAKEARSSGKTVDSADRLARAFTLLSRAYSACRRAAAYVRWEQGDVDDLAPPLARRSGPGRKPGSAKEEPPPDPA